MAEEIRDDGGDAVGLQGDVTDPASVAALVAEGSAALGPIDVLVNNAGNAGADPTNLATRPSGKATSASGSRSSR